MVFLSRKGKKLRRIGRLGKYKDKTPEAINIDVKIGSHREAEVEKT